MRYRYIPLLLLCWFNITNQIGHAQQANKKSYKTTRGRIGLMGICRDTILITGSNRLLLALDYETAEVGFQVDLATVDTRNKKAKYLFKEIGTMAFRGQFNESHINPDHNYYDIIAKGLLLLNEQEKEITFFGELLRSPDDKISFYLFLNTDLSLSEFELTQLFSDCHPYFHIEILQSVIEKETTE